MSRVAELCLVVRLIKQPGAGCVGALSLRFDRHEQCCMLGKRKLQFVVCMLAPAMHVVGCLCMPLAAGKCKCALMQNVTCLLPGAVCGICCSTAFQLSLVETVLPVPKQQTQLYGHLPTIHHHIHSSKPMAVAACGSIHIAK